MDEYVVIKKYKAVPCFCVECSYRFILVGVQDLNEIKCPICKRGNSDDEKNKNILLPPSS